VSPLDSLIGPEYSTSHGGKSAMPRSRQPLNNNLPNGRGQRARPGQVPFPPAIEQTNEFAYVQQLRIPATGVHFFLENTAEQ
jgi:hypothetical protein